VGADEPTDLRRDQSVAEPLMVPLPMTVRHELVNRPDATVEVWPLARLVKIQLRDFASSKGDTSVAIETRIELVKSIVGMTTANKYARATLYFAYSLSGKTAENYIELIKFVR
jgi:hypothetical protein